MQLRVGDQPAAVRTLAGVGGQLVEIVVPVHNEERVLETSIWRLHSYLTASFPFSFRITIADNASTDATWLLAKRLGERLPWVRAVHIPRKGRGRALRQVWGASDAAVVRPAGAACSGPRSAARSPGCSRRRCSCWRPGCG